MNSGSDPAHKRRRSTQGVIFRIAAAAIVGVGLVASAVLHVVRAPTQPDASTYQVVNGQSFPVDSRRDMEQLERTGGKILVLVSLVQRWWAGLWEGQALAVTVAVLSIAIGCLCWHLGSLADETDP